MLELVPMELCWFPQVGLRGKAKDEEVWQLCQDRGYILLTGNRTGDDKYQKPQIHRWFSPHAVR